MVRLNFKKIMTLLCAGMLTIGSSNVSALAQSSTFMGYDNVKGFAGGKFNHVYFGDYNGSFPIKWLVLSMNGNEGTYKDDKDAAVDADKAMFLFPYYSFTNNTEIFNDNPPTGADKYDYLTSAIKTKCDTAFNSYFTSDEDKVFLKTSKNDPAGTGDQMTFYARDNILSDNKLFSLSAMESLNYGVGAIKKYGYLYTRYWNDLTTPNSSTNHWYRTKCKDLSSNKDWATCSDDGITVIPTAVDAGTKLAIRPGCNLNLNKVLMVSRAEGGKSDFSENTANTGEEPEWKLTIKQTGDFSDAASVASNEVYKGDSVTIRHKRLSDFGNYDTVTAFLMKTDGTIVCYGAINKDAAATSSALKIPDSVAPGSYKVACYAEKWNGDKKTDYAVGTPYEFSLTVKERPASSGGSSSAGSVIPPVTSPLNNKADTKAKENTDIKKNETKNNDIEDEEIILKDSSAKAKAPIMIKLFDDFTGKLYIKNAKGKQLKIVKVKNGQSNKFKLNKGKYKLSLSKHSKKAISFTVDAKGRIIFTDKSMAKGLKGKKVIIADFSKFFR